MEYQSERNLEPIILQLKNSLTYNTLELKCNSQMCPEVLSLVNECVYDAYQRSKMVLTLMGEYTLHDGEHLFHVLYLMDKLMPDKTIGSLEIPELMLLILCAFFHDIGMSPS